MTQQEDGVFSNRSVEKYNGLLCSIVSSLSLKASYQNLSDPSLEMLQTGLLGWWGLVGPFSSVTSKFPSRTKSVNLGHSCMRVCGIFSLWPLARSTFYRCLFLREDSECSLPAFCTFTFSLENPESPAQGIRECWGSVGAPAGEQEALEAEKWTISLHLSSNILGIPLNIFLI